MEDKEIKSKDLNSSRLILFGFEINHYQATLILIFSFIGLLVTAFELTIVVSFTVLYNTVLPNLTNANSSDSNNFTDLYNRYARAIIDPIIFSILFYLSLYCLKKILSHNNIASKNRRRIIPQNRVVNWFGLKLSHGQSIFIFSLSLSGVLFLIEFYIVSTTPILSDFFENLCSIPTGPNSFIWHESFAKKTPILICAIFTVLCLYSLIITRRGKIKSPKDRFIKNHGLVIFIISFIIFSFNLIPLSNHIYFYMHSIVYNKFQRDDFHRVILITVICLILIISSYFLKENRNKHIVEINKLTFFGVKLTEKRAILLLSVAIIGITYLGYISAVYFFMIGGISDNFLLSSILIVPIIFIILSYYAINKIVKNHRLTFFINTIENLEDISSKWFKFNLNRLNSVIFYSISCGFIIFNVGYLIMIGISVRVWSLFSVNYYQEDMPFIILYLIENTIWVSIIISLLSINIYTIKRTKFSFNTS